MNATRTGQAWYRLATGHLAIINHWQYDDGSESWTIESGDGVRQIPTPEALRMVKERLLAGGAMLLTEGAYDAARARGERG